MRKLLLLFLLLVNINIFNADTIILKNLKKINGDITSINESFVTIRTYSSMCVIKKMNILNIQRDYSSSRYIRFSNTGDLEVPIKTFIRGNVRVSLIAAIHISDKSYFMKLQCFLDNRQLVLFEGVGDPYLFDIKDFKIDKKEFLPKRKIHYEEDEFSNDLGLETQNKNINYRRNFFVNSDISLQQLHFFIEKRAFESFFSKEENGQKISLDEVYLREYSDKKNQNLSKLQMKKLGYAKFLVENDTDDISSSYKKAILTDRNNVLMFMLERTFLNPWAKDIGVFYGAYHMPEIEKFLIENGFSIESEKWIVCWDI